MFRMKDEGFLDGVLLNIRDHQCIVWCHRKEESKEWQVTITNREG